MQLFFLYPITIFCQGNNSGQGSGVDDFRNFTSYTTGVWITDQAKSNKIIGSPYLFPDWNNKAIITSADGKEYRLNNINYDAVLDRMVSQISQDSVYAFNPASIQQVNINYRIFKRFLDPELGRNSFYEVLVPTDADLEILKRNMKVVKEGTFNPMTQKQAPSRYIQQEKNFIYKNGVLEELPSSKRKFLQFFEVHSGKVQNFISENNLSVRDENDIKKILIYYDSL